LSRRRINFSNLKHILLYNRFFKATILKFDMGLEKVVKFVLPAAFLVTVYAITSSSHKDNGQKREADYGDQKDTGYSLDKIRESGL